MQYDMQSMVNHSTFVEFLVCFQLFMIANNAIINVLVHISHVVICQGPAHDRQMVASATMQV